MAILRINLLGRFAVEYREEAVPQGAWKRRRPVEVLTRLALAPGHVLHREELIDALWPEKDLDAGANNLYRTLHDLRKITGDDVVSVERGAIRLPDESWVDVSAFESAISLGTRSSLAEAIGLYDGDLLPDDPYADHLQARREGLRQRFVDGALRLAKLQADIDAEAQLSTLRRVLEVEPTLEEAHRLLMAALAAGGRIKEAVRQYSECVRVLSDFDSEPSALTTELHRRIKSGDVGRRNDDSERETNWSEIALRLLGTDEPGAIRGRSAAVDAIEGFAAAERGALLVVGEAGAGKTRLSVECARRCAERGAVTLAGLGCDFEGAAPYSPFVDALGDIARLSPGANSPFASFAPTPGGSAQEDRLRLFQSVEKSIVELAGGGQTCLLIEDLHLADESSLQLFHHLARASRHIPLKLIGTLREEEIHVGNPLHVLLSSLGRERMTTRINLERLDIDASRELVTDLWGKAPEDGSLELIYRLADGNPFYLEEVASSHREAGESAFAPSEDLMQTVRARMARLGANVERLLLAASVQGVRFDFEIARSAIGIEVEPALDALDLALSARVVEEHTSRYRFRHALMREALYESLSNARRIYMHRVTVEAFEARGGAFLDEEPEVLAYHHQAAGHIQRALPHTLRAIENAQTRLGFGEAITHSERALELMDTLGITDGLERFTVTRDMGAMRVALGDLDHAIRNLDAAADLCGDGDRPSSVDRCNAKRLAGLALIEAGNLESAEEHLDDALASLGDERESSELSSVYYLYSQLRWHQSRHSEAFELAEKCLAEAERVDDNQAIAKGYEMLALACHSLGEWKRGTKYEEQRKEVAGVLDVASAFDVHL